VGDELNVVGTEKINDDEDNPALHHYTTTLISRPAIVRKVTSDGSRVLPYGGNRMFAVTSPNYVQDAPDPLDNQWSGAFVGRYDAKNARWEYVGHLVSGFSLMRGRLVHFVASPPKGIIKWLMSGSDGD